MAVELLNCLALRKLLFINILSPYGFFLKVFNTVRVQVNLNQSAT